MVEKPSERGSVGKGLEVSVSELVSSALVILGLERGWEGLGAHCSTSPAKSVSSWFSEKPSFKK